MISNTFLSKNENHDNNFAIFTSSIKENNIIHRNEESTKNIKNFIWRSFHEQ